MAAVKIVYIGGGGTRAPGTLASFVQHAAQFAGSEIVLVDPLEEAMELSRRVGQRFAAAAGAKLRIRTCADRRKALAGADVVLTSFRPGGFECRALDERIPLKYNVIGQETQGPGGFFMALRTLHVMRGIVADMEELCPNAFLINYTNPVNIVEEAVTHHSALRCISLCEGPIVFGKELIEAVGLEPHKLDAAMIGLNHANWSVRHLYDGQDAIAVLRGMRAEVAANPAISSSYRRRYEIACAMGHLPAHYFQYYFFRDEIVREMQAAPRTRSELILAEIPRYREHYQKVAQMEQPYLDPALSRGGILELELAVEVIAAIINDTGQVFPCNVPNQGSIPNFPADLTVETYCRIDRHGATPLVQPALPNHLMGLLGMLAAYQAAAAQAGWNGSRQEALRALLNNPLCYQLPQVEELYNAMARAQAAYLPQRLLA